MRIVIPGERPMSWNMMYSGGHWTLRRAEAERVHRMVRAYAPYGEETISIPVEIEMIVWFDHHPTDASNITVKLYEDGLIYAGIIPDDSYKTVLAVTTRSRVDKEYPRVEIIIREAK